MARIVPVAPTQNKNIEGSNSENTSHAVLTGKRE
jgi:hypothetical protein